VMTLRVNQVEPFFRICSREDLQTIGLKGGRDKFKAAGIVINDNQRSRVSSVRHACPFNAPLALKAPEILPGVN